VKTLNIVLLIATSLLPGGRLAAESINESCRNHSLAGLWELKITPALPVGVPKFTISALVLFGPDGTFAGQGGSVAGGPPSAVALGSQAGQALGRWEQLSATRFLLVAYNPILNSGIVNGFQPRDCSHYPVANT
jgi:hypothetical protein